MLTAPVWSPLRLCLLAISIALAALLMQNLAVAAFFPRLTRVSTDFSPAYLDRELGALAKDSAPVVFLGDSVLWGYRLEPGQAAVSLLAARGCVCRNLSFKGSSPPNYYALSLLLADAGVRPRAIVLEVNQKVLNEADDAYRKLHPAVAALAWPLLSPGDRERLAKPAELPPLLSSGDRLLAAVWLPYAMRSDLREALTGEHPPPLQTLTPDLFEGDYDTSALDDSNAGVHYLEATAKFWDDRNVPVFAFITPVNHALLHDYVDNAEYRGRAAYLREHLSAHGARVEDYDGQFMRGDFIDENHLTGAAQQRFANLLAAGCCAERG